MISGCSGRPIGSIGLTSTTFYSDGFDMGGCWTWTGGSGSFFSGCCIMIFLSLLSPRLASAIRILRLGCSFCSGCGLIIKGFLYSLTGYSSGSTSLRPVCGSGGRLIICLVSNAGSDPCPKPLLFSYIRFSYGFGLNVWFISVVLKGALTNPLLVSSKSS